MRCCLSFLVVCGTLAAAEPARSDGAPVLVVPGRPDVPVMINGVDASWGIVEGDWGLYRPGAVPVTVIPALIGPNPNRGNGYFPSEGHAPRLGRVEREPPPNRTLPPPAESFHRSWGAASDPAPATIPNDPPAIIQGSGYESQDLGPQSQDRSRFSQRRDHSLRPDRFPRPPKPPHRRPRPHPHHP